MERSGIPIDDYLLITVEQGESGLEVKRPNDERDSRSRHGLTRTLINNMVIGVTEGYEKKPRSTARVTASWPRAPTSSSPSATAASLSWSNQTRFSVQGIDKQLVGEVAANIRKLRKPDPYKAKGVRYAGAIRRKVGKAGKK